MHKNTTPSEVKAFASKLRDILASHGHQLKHTESLEVISKLEGNADWNTYSAHLTKLQKTLEQNPSNSNTQTSSSAPDDPKNPEEQEILHCSFCGKSQHEVLKIIAGPESQICEHCTELCIDIVIEEMQDHPSEHPNGFKDLPRLSSLLLDGQHQDSQSELSD